MATFALIPGAGGDAWDWHRVTAELTGRRHRAVALALPAADPDADFDTYTDACVDQLVTAGVDIVSDDDIVVVGLSLGGFTAPILAARVGATRIVLANAMIPHPRETPGHWFSTSGAGPARAALAAEQGRTLGDDMNVMAEFFHDVPADLVAEAMSRPEPEQADGIMGCETPFDAWPAPVTVISGRDDRFFPPDFQQRIARERLGVEPTIVPGGHLMGLSRPAEVTDALLSG